MFDLEAFVGECRAANRDADPRGAVRELLIRTLEHPDDVAAALGKDEAGINIVDNAPDLTILNVIWAPEMTLLPHEHRMWAAIGIYGGAEANTLYRRTPESIAPAGGRELNVGDVLGLGADAIHSVRNPRRQFTGAIHIYGGDFVNQPRSQWDPDTFVERPHDMNELRRLFAEANAAWRAQLGHDLDEQTD